MPDSLSISLPPIQDRFDEEFDLLRLDPRLREHRQTAASPLHLHDNEFVSITIVIQRGRL